MTEPRIRAGHAERQAAVDRLTTHFTEGRLTPDEFDERVGKAYAATYLDGLPELFADLPNDQPQRSIGPYPAAAWSCGSPGRSVTWSRHHGPPLRLPRILFLALLVALVFSIGALTHGFFAFPLVWFAVVLFFMSGAARRRRWAHPGGAGYRAWHEGGSTAP